jgi:hypothetical protein
MPKRLYENDDTHVCLSAEWRWTIIGLLGLVYRKLMIVSTTVTSRLLDVVDVLDGAGAGTVVGISPAKVDAESAHMSATAIANRFIDSAPLGV